MVEKARWPGDFLFLSGLSEVREAEDKSLSFPFGRTSLHAAAFTGDEVVAGKAAVGGRSGLGFVADRLARLPTSLASGLHWLYGRKSKRIREFSKGNDQAAQ